MRLGLSLYHRKIATERIAKIIPTSIDGDPRILNGSNKFTTPPLRLTVIITMQEMKSKVLSNVSKNSTIVGSVISKTSNTIEISQKNKKYTVNVDTGNDIIVNRNWDKINFSDIKVNDKVSVFGLTTGNATTINAKVVRDISLPVISSEENGD